MSKNLCPVVRRKIVEQWKAGKEEADIAADLKCSTKTVRRWIKRFGEGGESALSDHRIFNGRPRKTTQKQDEDILTCAAQRPFGTIVEVINAADLHISERTVRRRLHEAGYHYHYPSSHRPIWKIPLSIELRDQQLAFALNNLTTKREEGKITIWIDEKVFVSYADQFHMCGLNDETLNSNNVVITDDKISCAMWIWVSGDIIGELIDIPTRMDSTEYIRVMEEVFLPSVRAVYPEEDVPNIQLVQVTSAMHTSRKIQLWFRNNPDIHLVQWPSRSLNLNLLENVWAQMIQLWEPREEKTTTALITHAKEVWEELRCQSDFLPNLINSMIDRFN